MIDTFSANLSTSTYQEITRWVYAGVAALFGVIGVSAAFVSDAANPWVGLVAILTTAIVILSALRWPHRSWFALMETGRLLAVGGWIAAVWVGATPATGFALFLPLVYGIATRRPWWPWAASVIFAIVTAPLAAAIAGVLPAEGWLTNQIVAISFLGALVAVFLSIELGWVIFARIDAHRADENDLSLTRERLRFANELHDVQGHTLLAIKLKAELARRNLDRDVDTTRTELAEIERLVAEASAQTRQIANGYRTASLATELANAGQLLGAAGIRVEVEPSPRGLGRWEPLIAIATREAVSNILRHATPTVVTLRFTDAAVVITNDGATPDHDISSGGGNGLRSLQERFREQGGNVHWALGTGRRPVHAHRHLFIRRQRTMIRVYLTDDEEMLRTALASLLALDDDFTVIAQAACGDTVLTDPARAETDVFLLDLEMPGLGGLDTAKALLHENPNRRTVIVTRHARPGILRSALAAGVRGFVPKNTPAEQLAAIICRVHQGERYVDADLALDAISVDCPLTERELDALRLTEEGKSVPEIAAHLHLAAGTVRNYLSDAITKLGVKTRHAAAKHAKNHGWI